MLPSLVIFFRRRLMSMFCYYFYYFEKNTPLRDMEGPLKPLQCINVLHYVQDSKFSMEQKMKTK